MIMIIISAPSYRFQYPSSARGNAPGSHRMTSLPARLISVSAPSCWFFKLAPPPPRIEKWLNRKEGEHAFGRLSTLPQRLHVYSLFWQLNCRPRTNTAELNRTERNGTTAMATNKQAMRAMQQRERNHSRGRCSLVIQAFQPDKEHPAQ